MRILVSADMEGATGATGPADVTPGTEQWQRCRAMFTSDVNAAEYGVPVLLVTGDDRACADAAAYAPDARTVAVKRHVSRYAAERRPPGAATYGDIAEAARAAAAEAGATEPERTGPFTAEVDVDAAHLAGAAALVPGVELVAPRRVRYTATIAFGMIRCFKAVTTLVSDAVESDYG
ncbi:M55 family metallopeptidase [Streptomonospora salina]|uniref:D-aminopeptidase n=1 Tax=Streptomonospora salina TaxID=104205 RepID=A0A841EBR5_9ACTN|nr:M55 family metallopeptidase [Streptomonospora salina]MBB5996891.1 D-aminopeptidase [Streptomonospora salina]